MFFHFLRISKAHKKICILLTSSPKLKIRVIWATYERTDWTNEQRRSHGKKINVKTHSGENIYCRIFTYTFIVFTWLRSTHRNVRKSQFNALHEKTMLQNRMSLIVTEITPQWWGENAKTKNKDMETSHHYQAFDTYFSICLLWLIQYHANAFGLFGEGVRCALCCHRFHRFHRWWWRYNKCIDAKMEIPLFVWNRIANTRRSMAGACGCSSVLYERMFRLSFVCECTIWYLISLCLRMYNLYIW